MVKNIFSPRIIKTHAKVSITPTASSNLWIRFRNFSSSICACRTFRSRSEFKWKVMMLVTLHRKPRWGRWWKEFCFIVKRYSWQGVHHSSSHLVLIESGAGLQLFYLYVPLQVEIQTKDIDWWDYTGNGDGDDNVARGRWQRVSTFIRSPKAMPRHSSL